MTTPFCILLILDGELLTNDGDVAATHIQLQGRTVSQGVDIGSIHGSSAPLDGNDLAVYSCVALTGTNGACGSDTSVLTYLPERGVCRR